VNAFKKMTRRIGTRLEVWEGSALQTSSGLKKEDFLKKRGKIVSRRRSEASKKNAERLREYQFKKSEKKNE